MEQPLEMRALMKLNSFYRLLVYCDNKESVIFLINGNGNKNRNGNGNYFLLKWKVRMVFN